VLPCRAARDARPEGWGGEDDVDGGGAQRQPPRVRLDQPAGVAGRGQHLRREVDADHPAAGSGGAPQRDQRPPGAAADVQCGLTGPDPGLGHRALVGRCIVAELEVPGQRASIEERLGIRDVAAVGRVAGSSAAKGRVDRRRIPLQWRGHASRMASAA
jgi:hypothetical protein